MILKISFGEISFHERDKEYFKISKKVKKSIFVSAVAFFQIEKDNSKLMEMREYKGILLILDLAKKKNESDTIISNFISTMSKKFLVLDEKNLEKVINHNIATEQVLPKAEIPISLFCDDNLEE